MAGIHQIYVGWSDHLVYTKWCTYSWALVWYDPFLTKWTVASELRNYSVVDEISHTAKNGEYICEESLASHTGKL